MKSISLLQLLCAGMLMLTVSINAQDKEYEKKIKKIADDACECTDKISTAIPNDSIVVEINACIRAFIMVDQMAALKPEQIDTTDSLKKNITIYANQDFDEIQSYMNDNCAKVRSLLSSNDVKNKYSMSKNKKALKYYDEGLDYMNAENYDQAIVSFNKAVKEDKKFAFAWDNLGISYRKRGNYKEAIKCYEKSIEIDPDGGMPRQNLPIAYEYLKDYKKAGEAYESLIKFNPKDPEGYYGAGRTFFLEENYEKGVDYMFKAYVMYTEVSSPYVNDAQKYLGAMLSDLQEKGKEDIFMKAAENNGVDVK
ncbi:MAG: tetratricopeptide repeat protein [Bacteroidota bacterium]